MRKFKSILNCFVNNSLIFELSILFIFACSQTKVINLEDAAGSLGQTEATSKIKMVRYF
jgi:hypothetical protein